MPDYTVTMSNLAARELKKLTHKAQGQVRVCIDTLKKNPRNNKVTKLTDRENVYRCRTGDFRILFEIQDSQLVILVLRILDRKDAYK